MKYNEEKYRNEQIYQIIPLIKANERATVYLFFQKATV